MVVRLENTGNAMISGWGWAMLRRSAGGLVSRWRIGSRDQGERRVIYPGRYVDLYLPIERQLTAGEYIASARLDYAPNRAALGELALNVTEEQARDVIITQSGPFQSLTLGLSVLVDRELEEVAVAPGGFRTGVLTVTNNEDADLLVEMSVSDVTMDPDGVLTPATNTEDTALTVSEWLRAGPERFQLLPGMGRRVQYVVGPPRGEEIQRDLVGLIRIRARRLDPMARSAEQEVIGEAGTLIVASIAGRGKLRAELDQLQVDVNPELPGMVRFGVPVKNTGDVHFFPVVSLSLQPRSPGASNLEATAGLGKSRTLVLPGMERVLWLSASRQQLAGGTFLAKVVLNYGANTPVSQGFTVELQDLQEEVGLADGARQEQPVAQPEPDSEPGRAAEAGLP